MADQIITYTLNLPIKRAIRREEWDAAYPEAEHLASYHDAKAFRELEREVIQCLRRLDGDCDVEVMEHAISDEDAS